MFTDSGELQKVLLPIKDDISAILRAHGFPERVPFLPYVAQKRHYPRANTIHQGKLSPVQDDTTMTKIRTREK
jgi:hypothetical protein